jgi:pilus assembly protein CpaB
MMYMNRVEAAVDPRVAVVAAKVDIPARAALNEDMVTLKRIPEGAVHTEAIGSLSPVMGKTTKQAIRAGEQVLASKLFRERYESGLAFVVPPGRRAMAIDVDQTSGVGGLVVAGDRIDVLGVCTVTLEREAAEKRTAGVEVSKTIFALQDVEVLAVAQKVAGDDAAITDQVRSRSSLASTPVRAQTQPSAKTLTLSLQPNQAEWLLLIESNSACNTRLALRSYEEQGQIDLLTTEMEFDPAKPLIDPLRKYKLAETNGTR